MQNDLMFVLTRKSQAVFLLAKAMVLHTFGYEYCLIASWPENFRVDPNRVLYANNTVLGHKHDSS